MPVPPFDSLRLPSFYRLDIRLEKRWRVFRDGYLSFVVEGMNVTLNKEAIDVTCQSDGTVFPLKYDKCEPAVPRAGLRAERRRRGGDLT